MLFQWGASSYVQAAEILWIAGYCCLGIDILAYNVSTKMIQHHSYVFICGCQTTFIITQESYSIAKAFLLTPSITGSFVLPIRRAKTERTGKSLSFSIPPRLSSVCKSAEGFFVFLHVLSTISEALWGNRRKWNKNYAFFAQKPNRQTLEHSYNMRYDK